MPPLTRTVRTTCNRDCPDGCGILAHVKDGRIVRLQGDPDHPVTRGFLCYRTSHFLTRHYAPDRITTPLIRRDNVWHSASWHEALDLVARKMNTIRDQSGAGAIFHYQSGGSLGALKTLCGYFFENFGPVTVKSGDICSGALDYAQLADFGDTESNDLEDLGNARNIIVWGKNVYTSSPHTVPFLKEAKKNGARILLVDVLRTKTHKVADTFIQPKPAGDLALALAVGQLLFASGVHPDLASYANGVEAYRALCFSRRQDELLQAAGVSLADAGAIADALRQGPTSILIGWGMARRTSGASIVRAIDALALLSGNIGIAGAGASFYFHRKRAFDFSFRTKANAGTISEARFGEEVLAQKPRMIWVTAGNPVAMLPDSTRVKAAFEQTEFVVVADSWMSDTARLADVILPTTTLLEDDDLLAAYGHHYLATSAPVVPARGEAKTDLQILQALAPRVGLAGLLDGDARSWKRKISKVDIGELNRAPMRNPFSPCIAFSGRVFPTPTGKAQFLSEVTWPPSKDADYPFTLMAVSSPKAQSSQDAGPPVEIAACRVHPSTGLEDGQAIIVQSRHGQMRAQLVLDDSVHPSVAHMDKGGSLFYQTAPNILLAGRHTDHGEGAALYDEAVRLLLDPT